MALVDCSWSGEPLYSGYYSSDSDSIRSATYLNITNVQYDTVTTNISIAWQLVMSTPGSGGRYSCAGVYCEINDVALVNSHGSAGGYLWDYTGYSNGTIAGSGTYTMGKSSSVSMYVKGMWSGGWSEARWSSSSYLRTNSGTLSITYPTIGNPTINTPTISTSTTGVSMEISGSAGTNGGNVSFSTTLNDTTVSGTSPSWSGLHPHTSYSYTITATNSAGLTKTYTGTVTTNMPSLPTYTVGFDSITRTSARMVISITNDPDNYWMIYYYNASDSWLGATSKENGTYYYTYSGLTPNTTYTFFTRVGASSSGGADQDVQSRVNRVVTTIGNAPTITTHGCSNPGQTTATMNYSATYDTNDSLGSYRWDYGTTTSYGSSVTNTNNITGLATHTTYYYKLTVTSSKGRSSVATGSFITDYATQQITNLAIGNITTTSIEAIVSLADPSIITNVQCWIYYGDGTTLISTINKNTDITTSNTLTFENLPPGILYSIKAQITTIGGYLSNIISTVSSTIDDTPIALVHSDGTVAKYKAYVLGMGNIYNSKNITWQNGYYTTGVIGDSIADLLTQPVGALESAACGQTHIEILPNITYSIKNDDVVSFIIHGTDVNNLVTFTGYTISPGNTYNFVSGSTTTRLWISIYSNGNPYINLQTARYYNLQIFKNTNITLIENDSIVKINGKIRYIDIYQSGNNIDDGSHIVELEVYDKNGNNIALNKNVSLVKGGYDANLDRVTDGIVDTTLYCDIGGRTTTDLETIVRVDLGSEYTNIDHIKLWRYWADGRIYNNTKIYGRDATTQLTWKFQSYKIGGVYQETSDGYTGYITNSEIISIPYINAIALDPLNSVNTITGTKITIDANEIISIPPVIDSLVSYRTDMILAANQGRILKSEIGDLTELTTTEKDSIVEAINEIWENVIPISTSGNVLNAVLNALLNA